MVRNCHVFIYEEWTTDIKRWNDRGFWSKGRIVGDFVVYEELVENGSTSVRASGIGEPPVNVGG